MTTLILTIHILTSLAIILIVLLQSGKGAGISGIFGGGGGDAVFSPTSGSLFLRKITTGLAVTFFLTSILLTYLAAKKGQRTVTQGAFTGAPAAAPGPTQSIPLVPTEKGATKTPPAPSAEPVKK